MKRTTEPRWHGGGRNSNLTQGDLQLIETIKREMPTLSLREIYDGFIEFGDIPKGTSRSAISRPLNNNMLSGLNIQGKKSALLPKKDVLWRIWPTLKCP